MADLRIARLVRFALVGVSVALIYYVLFLWLRSADLARVLASTLAFAVAVAVQYVAQTWWTFGASPARGRYARRFAAMVGTGAILSAVITGILGPAVGASDAVAAAVTVVTLPVFNFVVMSAWVYRDPGPGQPLERRS
ncbi:MAG: GtrA family protein [Thermohalobaculum sp.]|nr:GtrA family protein [Thermohalobaculum sp.]